MGLRDQSLGDDLSVIDRYPVTTDNNKITALIGPLYLRCKTVEKATPGYRLFR